MSQSASEVEAAFNLAGDAVMREANGAAHLVGSRCRDCGAPVFPPVAVCPHCMSENVERIALSRRGSLYSWSVVHAAPRGWKLPYIAGYVDLPEGVRVFAHIVEADPKTLRFDMPVVTTIATLGADEQGHPIESYAFRPANEGDT